MNWSIRPNLEGRISIKPEGRIYEEMAELLKTWKAEFDHKAEYMSRKGPEGGQGILDFVEDGILRDIGDINETCSELMYSFILGRY